MKIASLSLLVIVSSLLCAETSGTAFTNWWPGFQNAVAKRDSKTVAQGAGFPMNWENGGIREIKTKAELLNRFDVYFTPEVRKKVSGGKPARLPNGTYILTWKARGNEYSLYFKPGGGGVFSLDGLSEGPP